MQNFDTKDSNTLESFDRKFEITDEVALPASESFDTFSTKARNVST